MAIFKIQDLIPIFERRLGIRVEQRKQGRPKKQKKGEVNYV